MDVQERLFSTPSTYLMILIITMPGEISVRRTIRNTWLLLSTKTPLMFRHIFPIGLKNLSSDVRNSVDAEMKEHNDVVPFHNLTDAYNKLSMKTALSISYKIS